MKILQPLVLLAVMAIPTSSIAYVLDETTNIVTDEASGLEWLKWTETSNLSINAALSTYKDDGWRMASNADMALLLNDFLAPIVQIELAENETVRQVYTGVYGDGVDPVVELGRLFGWTEYEQSISVTSGDVIALGNYSTSIVKFGESAADAATLFNSLSIISEFTFERNGDQVGRPERAILDFDEYSGLTNGNGRIGVALVRDVGASTVPEPSSVALLVLGLFGLSYVRHRTRIH